MLAQHRRRLRNALLLAGKAEGAVDDGNGTKRLVDCVTTMPRSTACGWVSASVMPRIGA